MTSIIAEIPDEARAHWVEIASSVARAFNFELPALRLVAVRPDDGSPGARVPVNIGGDYGLIDRDHPDTIFVNALTAPHSRRGIAGTIGHELVHVAMLYGQMRTNSLDRGEFRAKQMGADIGRAYDVEDHAGGFIPGRFGQYPFDSLFADDHPRAEFYRAVRSGEHRVPVSGGWGRADFWTKWTPGASEPSNRMPAAARTSTRPQAPAATHLDPRGRAFGRQMADRVAYLYRGGHL